MENPETTTGGKGRKSRQVSDKPPAPKLRYFVPGQLCLIIDHDSTPQELQRALEAKGSLRNYFQRTFNVTTNKPTITTLENQSSEHGAFTSVVTVNVNSQRKMLTSDEIVPLIRRMRAVRKKRENAPKLVADQYAIRHESINWLFAGSPDNITTGGPGGWPLEVDCPEGDPPYFTLKANTLVDLLVQAHISDQNAQQEDVSKKSVNVIILDTVPSPEQIDYALKHYPCQTLLTQMMGSGKFHIGYASSNGIDLVDPDGPDGYAIEGHVYPMTSHGLFIAGLVHNLAPRANIYLIETLNKYGVGDVTSLVQALSKIQTGFVNQDRVNVMPADGDQIIVNCSFTVSFSDEDEKLESISGIPLKLAEELMAELGASLFGFGTKTPTDAANNAAAADAASAAAANEAVSSQFAKLAGRGIKILAAAGNDSFDRVNTGQNPKEARYPARYDTVIGVAALKEDGTPAPYSNNADKDLPQGVATLGGGGAQARSRVGGGLDSPLVTTPGEGVVGIFIDQFPDDKTYDPDNPETLAFNPNTTGWAEWSGTSFAAPVLAGLMAFLVTEIGASSLNQAESWLRQTWLNQPRPSKVWVEQK